MIRTVSLGFVFAFATVLVAGHANSSPKCANEAWNYCGSSIDKCCPPDRPFACINVRKEMHGALVHGGPTTNVPRGWSGCVGPATAVSQAEWSSSCTRWVKCSE